MFKIGDKIVYPSQGIGVVDLIEEREFDGKIQDYYKIHLLNDTMKLTLPCSRVKQSGMRLISDCKTIDNKLKNITDYTTDMEELKKSSYKDRILMNSDKIKSGSLVDYLEVICNLTQVRIHHHLTASEKRILDSTKKVVIEEISQSKDISNEVAEDLLNLAINF
ncbi:CarD family transcriptional regulator [Clostridium paraputrificum]|uniref:CarD family transcriptional regulator n=1 Tax=Clostridium TaxID=1485 RepID=UPI003D3515AD